MGMHHDMLAYRMFAVPVLLFVMQLVADHPDLNGHFAKAVRGLPKGPGNWISESDLYALSFLKVSPCEFPTLEAWSLASRVRVLFSLGMTDIIEQANALKRRKNKRMGWRRHQENSKDHC